MQHTKVRRIGRSLCAGAFVSVLAAGCFGGGGAKPEQVATTGSGNWIHASPILMQQIKDEAARLPWTHGFDRLEQIRWFASVGEPAYDTLLELAVDARDDVAAAALAALGATMDRRLVPFLNDLDWGAERSSDLELERARALVRLGDWSCIPTLIRGLEDERLYTRSLCIEALKEATHETQGFDPRAEAAQRQVGVERWNAWWLARSGEGLLPSGQQR